MLKIPKIITRTLSVHLSCMVVFAIAILLTSSLAVMFVFARQTVRGEALQNAEQTLAGTLQHIDNILLSVEQSAGNIYWDVLPHVNEPEKMEDYCRRLVQCNPYIVGCAIAFTPHYYADHDLFMTYVRRRGKSMMTTDKSDLVTTSTFGHRPYTEQAWFAEPIKKQRAIWSDPMKNEEVEGEALTTFSLPIFSREGKCVGVLAADVALSLLSQIVMAAKPSPNGYTTLLGRNGSYLVHPDTNKLLHETVYTQLEKGVGASVREAAEAMMAGKTGYKRFQLDGKDCYVFYKPFTRYEVPGRSMEKLGWSVGVVYPEDDIFGDYNKLLYYVLAIAIIGLLLFYVLCRSITHRQLLPLRMLTKSAQHIAEGNYNEMIPTTTREDEIGQLQRHFHQMQQALAAHVGELKQLTTVLKERSEVLQKVIKRTQEADRMKLTFLHNMTNQMIKPANAISESVETLCHMASKSASEKEDTTDVTEQAEEEVKTINAESKVITDLLNHLLDASDSEKGKGVRYGK